MGSRDRDGVALFLLLVFALTLVMILKRIHTLMAKEFDA